MRHSLTLITVSLLLLVGAIVTAQSAYPGANYFSYQCEADGITFYAQNSATFYVAYDRLEQGLQSAVMSGRNQLIAATSEIGLWALQSNEYQMHRHNDADNTKMVWPGDICRVETRPSPSPSRATGAAYVAVQSGVNGQVTAYAVVTESGNVVAYVQTQGHASAIAYAQSFGVRPANNQSFHIVQSGDTLYSIARRYRTAVATLTRLNNISDPDHISVGQRIILP